MIEDRDLAHWIEEYDMAEPKEKIEMERTVNEELINAYKLWKHVNGGTMMEFFKFIAEAEGHLTAYAPSPINHTDGFVMLDKSLARKDVIEYLDDDVEELEQTFQLFDELTCKECGETAEFSIDEEELICPNCGRTINPFKQKEEKPIIKDREAFIKWAKLWHGDHEECDIREALDKYEEGKTSFDAVVSAVMETDDGWAESFETFLEK